MHKYQCTNCLRAFVDDAPSAPRDAHVFCVFCGTRLPAPGPVPNALPFGAGVARDQDFALGVIGTASSGFRDTLRQFRAPASAPNADSLLPLASDPDAAAQSSQPAAPWRLGSFWASLGVGFGVGAAAALFVNLSAAPPPTAKAPAVATPPTLAAQAQAQPLPTPQGVADAAPAASARPPPSPAKPVATPALERRFWLDRARAAQRAYHLNDAERSYRRALANAPRDSEALTGLGEVELLRGTVTEAAARFREALTSNADYIPALVAVADLHWQSGQAEAAREAYRQIVERYSADSYPPYVAQRSEATCVSQCQRVP